MILIVGATSRLGRPVIRHLLAKGRQVRVMTRTPEKAEDLKVLGAEVIAGDLRDAASLARACQGVEKVLAAAHGFPGQGDNNPYTVDYLGNRSLINAAKAAGVKHFVFVSGQGVRPDHPVDFFRHKYATEEYLRASGLSFTVLRPGAFMEFWANLVGQPVIEKGKTTIFGRGDNPINFVSVEDVARYVLIALDDPRARNQLIEIGGPENLTFNQVVQIFERVTGRSARKNHVPLPMMQVMSVLMRPFNRPLSRQIAAGVWLDTSDQRFDTTGILEQYPMQLTRLEEFIRRAYA